MAGTKDIAQILTSRDPGRYKSIIERAELNGYHDFKFDSIPGHPEYAECVCPKIQLLEDLSKFPELEDIRQNVIGGEYDEPPDAEDQVQSVNILMDENAPDGMFKMLGLKIPTAKEREEWHNKKMYN